MNAAIMIDNGVLAAVGELGMWSWLQSAYVICLIVGGGMLAVSTLLGGDSHGDVDAGGDLGLDGHADLDGADFDADTGGLDADAAHGADLVHADAAHHGAMIDGASLASWFSIRFVIYFMAVFGLIGTILSYLSGAGPLASFVAAMVGGVLVGQIVHQAIRWLRRSGGNSALVVDDYLNRRARVTVTIAPSAKGEVSLELRGDTRYVPARARRSDEAFKIGDDVVVVGWSQGTAEVLSVKEHEFLTEGRPNTKHQPEVV